LVLGKYGSWIAFADLYGSTAHLETSPRAACLQIKAYFSAAVSTASDDNAAQGVDGASNADLAQHSRKLKAP
jgi:hypothetical protein